MDGLNHQLARIREQEIRRAIRDRARVGEIPTKARTGRIRSLRRPDGSLWIFRLPRRVTA